VQHPLFSVQAEINHKVKQAKKRHKKKAAARDIDPFFFIAERLLLRNPKHRPVPDKCRKESVAAAIRDWRERSSVNFEAQNLSEWCIRHTQNVIKKRESAERRKREKQRKREARNNQKKRGSTFFHGGKTPRSPRSPRSAGTEA
jgi:hypothetical protein